jgi:hypothetical protein
VDYVAIETSGISRKDAHMKLTKINVGIGMMVLFVGIGGAWVQGQTAAQDSQAVRKALIDRLGHFKNVSIDYRLTDITPASPAMEKEKVQKEGKFKTITCCGTLNFKNRFSFLDGKKRYDSEIVSISKDGKYFLPPGGGEITAFLDDHVEYLVRGLNHSPTGYIKSQLSLPPYSGIEVALGMRAYLADCWITLAMIQGSDLKIDEKGRAVLTWMDEKKRSHEWTFDPKQGYAVTSYTIYHSGDKKVLVEITMSEFKAVGKMTVPYKMVMKSRRLGTGEISREKQFEVVECRIDDPHNVPANYHIAWPQGTAVIDERSMAILFADEKGQLIKKAKTNDQQKAKMATCTSRTCGTLSTRSANDGKETK